MKQKFNWRGFTSLNLLIAFVVIAISGIVLYLAPPGRVARWNDWYLLGLSLEEWQAHHTIFSYLFVILAVVHLFFLNWRAFVANAIRRASKGLQRWRELLAACLLFTIVFAGTQWNVAPFSSVMDLGSSLSDYWGESEGVPPVPHTEELSVEETARLLLSLTPQEFKQRIEAAGFVVKDMHHTLEKVALYNNTTPRKLFDASTKGLTISKLPVQ